MYVGGGGGVVCLFVVFGAVFCIVRLLVCCCFSYPKCENMELFSSGKFINLWYFILSTCLIPSCLRRGTGVIDAGVTTAA